MDLFYREFGSGPPVIMIHGLLGMSDNWVPISKKLDANYRLILPDLRNHGSSPHSDEFNIEVLTEDIIGLYHQLNLSSAVLIGHSLGGRVAISAALKYPELFSKLIVEDIAPRRYSGNKSIGNLLNAMSRLDLKDKTSFRDIDEPIKHLIPDVRNRQLALKNIRKNSKGTLEWKVNLNVIIKNVESLMMPVFGEAVFTKPTLFIKGGLSNLITQDDYKIIHKYFPSAEIETIPTAGHWVHADEPQLFLDKVFSFLNA